MTHLEHLEVEGLLILNTWIMDARLKGDASLVEQYERMLRNQLDMIKKKREGLMTYSQMIERLQASPNSLSGYRVNSPMGMVELDQDMKPIYLDHQLVAQTVKAEDMEATDWMVAIRAK